MTAHDSSDVTLPNARAGSRLDNRAIAAPGPEGDVETLRSAYLGLLKLAICDLVGPSTTSIEGLPGGDVVSRELEGEERAARVSGRDWPLHGLTMSGLQRLDDLQVCVESLVRDGIDGDAIEAGSWRGGSSILMRATFDSLGAKNRTVWVADSFAGFPVADPDRPAHDYPQTLGPYARFPFLTAPEEDVRGAFARLGLEAGTRFIAGFFEETLPALSGHPWSLVRLDGDTYSATKLGLEVLYPSLAVGGYLIVDDYGALEECRAAVDEFRQQHGIEEPLEEVDWTCVRWRRESDLFEGSGPAAPVPASSSRPLEKAPVERQRVLSARELELQERLREAEAELKRTRETLEEVTHSRSWRITKPLRELNPRQRRPARRPS